MHSSCSCLQRLLCTIQLNNVCCILDHVNPKSKYQVFLAAELTPDLKTTFTEMNTHKNVELKFVDAKMVRDMIAERCSKKMFEVIGKIKVKHPFDKFPTVPILPYLPYLFEKFESMLVLDENIIIEDFLDSLWNEHAKTTSMVAAAKNCYVLSRVKDIYPETLELHLSHQIKNPLEFFGIAAFVFNMKKYRERYNTKDITKAYYWKETDEKLRHKEEIMNVLCEGDIEWIDQRWNVWYASNMLLERQLPYMPLADYRNLQKAQKDPAVVCYMDDDPFGFEFSRVYANFWQYARRTPFYENIQTFQMKFTVRNQKPKTPVVAKVFPIDGRARGKMTKILPPGSRRNMAAKKVLGKLGLR